MRIRRAKRQLFALQALMFCDLAEATADAVMARIVAQRREESGGPVSPDLDVAKRLIAALDIIEDALSTRPQSTDGRRRKEPSLSAEAKALAVLRRNLLGILEGLGVERVDPVGQPVDFRVHDPAIVVPTLREDEDGVVSETLRAGYTSAGGKTLRAAMVAVLKYEAKQERATRKKKGT